MAFPDNRIRVRFAPSPTGLLHIGGLRTALYNYLFARQKGGDFILRLEDTDRERFVPEAEKNIIDALRWAGLDYDEGPDKEGPAGPYRQSERKAFYARHVQALIDGGHAYYAFDTPEELDAMRERLRADGHASPRYDASTRTQMKNSFTLPAGEVEARLARGDAHVVRMNVPENRTVQFDDVVRGTVIFSSDQIDDQVLLKSDGLPTYHLANVVDDHMMRVSHIIRGEEWLSSTPKHILLYEFLGWEPPVMVHLPLIHSPSGGKLSKRNADKMGIPINVHAYREAGYEPEALVNFLAMLGWNPGTEQEIFSLEELVQAFSLERIGSAGVQFNLDKLKWYNQQYLRAFEIDEVRRRVVPWLEREGIEAKPEYLDRVIALMIERIDMVSEFAEQARYFFADPVDYDEKGVKKRWKVDSADLLAEYARRLEAADTIDATFCEETLKAVVEEREVGVGRLMAPLRLAVSGVMQGPGLYDIIATLGKETTLRRIKKAAEKLG